MKTLAVLASLVLGTLINAQIATRGGAKAQRLDPNAFHSPMVLETTFAAADPSLWVSEAGIPQGRKVRTSGTFTIPEYHALGKFACDGVSLRKNNDKWKNTWDSGIEMKARPLDAGKVAVQINATVLNPAGNHNKMVTLFLEVMSEDEIVATTSIAIRAKDDDADHHGEGRLVVSRGSLKTSSMPKVRITMTTRNY